MTSRPSFAFGASRRVVGLAADQGYRTCPSTHLCRRLPPRTPRARHPCAHACAMCMGMHACACVFARVHGCICHLIKCEPVKCEVVVRRQHTQTIMYRRPLYTSPTPFYTSHRLCLLIGAGHSFAAELLRRTAPRTSVSPGTSHICTPMTFGLTMPFLYPSDRAPSMAVGIATGARPTAR